MRALLLVLILVATDAQAKMPHEQYHPEWLRKSWCCGEHDTRKVRVAWSPAGWRIVWIDNPPGYPYIRLVRPIPFDAGKMLFSKDGNWWASLIIEKGVATGIWSRWHGDGRSNQCIFGRGSGQ